jgi:hypothetical protein
VTVAGNVPLIDGVFLKADNTGVASCAKTSGGTQVGFEYHWTTGAIDVFDSKGCSERGF